MLLRLSWTSWPKSRHTCHGRAYHTTLSNVPGMVYARTGHLPHQDEVCLYTDPVWRTIPTSCDLMITRPSRIILPLPFGNAQVSKPETFPKEEPEPSNRAGPVGGDLHTPQQLALAYNGCGQGMALVRPDSAQGTPAFTRKCSEDFSEDCGEDSGAQEILSRARTSLTTAFVVPSLFKAWLGRGERVREIRGFLRPIFYDISIYIYILIFKIPLLAPCVHLACWGHSGAQPFGAGGRTPERRHPPSSRTRQEHKLPHGLNFEH